MATVYKPVKTEYLGTSIVSLLEPVGSNPLMMVKLDITGTTAPTSYSLHTFGTVQAYQILGGYISATKILVGTNAGGVGTLFKIDTVALTSESFTLPSAFSI